MGSVTLVIWTLTSSVTVGSTDLRVISESVFANSWGKVQQKGSFSPHGWYGALSMASISSLIYDIQPIFA